MPVLLKDADGPPRRLSSAEFRRLFRARYVRALRGPERLPRSFLNQCWKFLGALPRRFGKPAPTYVAKISAEIGYGLFALRGVEAGDFIGEYAGALAKNWVRAPRRAADFNAYLLKYPFDCEYAIDARDCGNETRFINHASKKANVTRGYFRRGGALRVAFIAKRRIPAGRQLLLDYGASYWRREPPVELKA